MNPVYILSGQNISGFTCASTFHRINPERPILITKDSRNLDNHFILINPVSFYILKGFFSNLEDILAECGSPILKHKIIDNIGSLTEISFSQTYIVDYGKLLKKIISSLKNKKNITFIDSNPIDIPSNAIKINPPNKGKDFISFGDRHLVQIKVKLKAFNTFCTYYESTDDTWFYLAPISKEGAILQFAVPKKTSPSYEEVFKLILKTKTLSTIIDTFNKSSIKLISIAPVFYSSIRPYNLLTGSSLLRFDPISGYGLHNSMRSSILVSAIIEKIENNPINQSELFDHYLNRNLTSMRDHILSCLNLYKMFDQKKWENEIEQMILGVSKINLMLKKHNHSENFVLKNFKISTYDD